jgi:hypothetical protein
MLKEQKLLDTAKYQWCMSRSDILAKHEAFYVEPLGDLFVAFALNKMLLIDKNYVIHKEFKTPFGYKSKLDKVKKYVEGKMVIWYTSMY